jgi:hypothetical protein
MLRMRTWHEDAPIDAETKATEAGVPRDPRERLSQDASSDQSLDRSRAFGRSFKEQRGLFGRGKDAGVRQRAFDLFACAQQSLTGLPATEWRAPRPSSKSGITGSET